MAQSGRLHAVLQRKQFHTVARSGRIHATTLFPAMAQCWWLHEVAQSR
jgi:hypothetical protein